jgi:hypothetical protein
MKGFRNVAILCIVIALSFGLSTISKAENVVGFEAGVNYLGLANDNRLTATATTFSLVFPIDAGLSAAVYHETSRIKGEDKTSGVTEENITSNLEVNELRIAKEIISTPIRAGLFLGLGHGSASSDTGALSGDALVVDVGAKITPLSKQGKVSEAKISIELLYRFFDIDPVDAFGGGVTDEVDDLGGFGIGINVGILF